MEKIIGEKKIYIDFIDKIIENKRISHAYLIEVDNYDDDYEYIKIFIKMILCNLKYDDLKKSNNKIIDLIDDDCYPDVYTISSDTSTIKKSLLIDLQKEFSNKSLYDNKKIYIIKECEKMNSFSANTILKFLEEPNENIIAFLLTNNRYHVIDTIVSRCQILSLKESNYDCKINDDNINFLNYILNPNSFFIDYNTIIKNQYSDKSLFKDGLLFVEEIIISYFNNNKYIFDNNISEILSVYDKNKLIQILSIIEEYLSIIDYNINYKLWLDSFLSRLIGG